MRLQDSQAGCGPASMSNALAACGVHRSQAECEVLCRTTGTDGTSPANLIRALRSVDGVDPAVLAETRAEVALLRLDAALRRGRPSILVVDAGAHYVAAVGLLGDRVLVADSADNELVLSLAPSELAERWACPGRTKYHGVIL